ncbi:hypothetical protein GCM10027347_44470 [Larkinella harenae]
MKKIFVVLVLAASFAGCKKEDAPGLVTNPAQIVSGKYAMTYYKEGPLEINLPSQGYSGEFVSTRIDDNHIDLVITLKDPTESETIEVGTLELKSASNTSNTFSLIQDGTDYGTITATEIMMKDTSPDGTVTEIRGKR